MRFPMSSESEEYCNEDFAEGEEQLEDGEEQPMNTPSIFRNKVILSILVTETAERVAYFGFRAVLVLYFHNGLGFSESASVSLFASVTGLAYLSPLVGALLADNQWGRYNTILRFGIIYSIGLFLITFGAYQLGLSTPGSCSLSTVSNTTNCGEVNDASIQSDALQDGNLLVARCFSFVGLVLVCLGTGGIKPCVSAFGADQVVLSDEHSQNRSLNMTQSAGKRSTAYSHLHLDEKQEDSCNDNHAMNATKNAQPTKTKAKPVVDNDQVREFFNSFYFCINVGALVSFAIIPVIRANYGFGAAFLIPTIFMTGALGIFLSQRSAYKHRERHPSEPSLFTTLNMCLTIVLTKVFQKFRSSVPGEHVPVSAGTSHAMDGTIEENHESLDYQVENRNNAITQVRRDAEQVLHLMPLLLFFPVFWMLYDQQGSVWTLQATRLNRHGLEPEQSGFLNPLEIMLFIPLFDKVIYPWLERRGFNIQPLRRMEYGMFLTAVAFFASTVLEYSIENGSANSISLAWQIPQITILTVAEILLNVTGLEFAYSQAPDSMQALILAVFLFMTAIGDGFGSILFATIFRELSSTVTMITCAVAMLINLGLFSRISRRWKPYNEITGTGNHHIILPRRKEEEGVELMPSSNGVMG